MEYVTLLQTKVAIKHITFEMLQEDGSLHKLPDFLFVYVGLTNVHEKW
jgi:hypothetical protein